MYISIYIHIHNPIYIHDKHQVFATIHMEPMHNSQQAADRPFTESPHMYIHMCICIYICIYVYRYIHIYIYIHILIYIHNKYQVFATMHLELMRNSQQAADRPFTESPHMYIHVYTCTYICIYIYICIHIYIHIHILISINSYPHIHQLQT